MQKKVGNSLIFLLSCLAAVACVLCGCVAADFDETLRYSGENDKLADLSRGLNGYFYCADGYTNGGFFDTVWRRDNITYNQEDKTLHLSITEDKYFAASGAEYRSRDKYGYGYFSVKMQSIKKEGVVTSFFVYTGPADRTRWDEIDVEILGKDTTKVQFNYYSNGIGNHEYMYSLGFDSSEGLHEYGFWWQEDSIIWFVDGKAVYRVDKNIPTTPGRIMISTWVGKSSGLNSVAHWLGKFDGIFPVNDAKYQWIGYKAI